jgi:hypothetical protein
MCNLRFADVDVEVTYNYTNESTTYAFDYSLPMVNDSIYEFFVITLGGTSTNFWSSILLKIQSGGYLQHVFFNLQYGTYNVTARVLHHVGDQIDDLVDRSVVVDERKASLMI